MDDGRWRMLFLFLIKFLASMCEDFYKFFAICIKTLVLNIIQIVIPIK